MVAKCRLPRPPRTFHFSGNVDQIGQMRGSFPGPPSLGQNQGKNRREFYRCRFVNGEPLPDAHHVTQKPQRNPGILGALMFKKQVQQDRGIAQANRE